MGSEMCIRDRQILAFVMEDGIPVPQILKTEENTLGLVWWPSDETQVEVEVLSDNLVEAVVTKFDDIDCLDVSTDLSPLSDALKHAYQLDGTTLRGNS